MSEPILETETEKLLPLAEVLGARAREIARAHPGVELAVILAALHLGAGLATGRATAQLRSLRADMAAARQ